MDRVCFSPHLGQRFWRRFGGVLLPAAVAASCAQGTEQNPNVGQAGTTSFAGTTSVAGTSDLGGAGGSTAGTPGMAGTVGMAGNLPMAGSGGSAGSGGFGGAAGSGGSAGTAGSAGSGGMSGSGGSAGTGGAGGTGGSSGAGGSGGASPCGVECTALRGAIVHRYSFNGTGTAVEDSVGTADGTVVNTTLSGTGSVVLAGGTSDQYVNLPNNLVSVLTDVTLEMWVNLAGVGNYPRVFDFGSSSMGEDLQGGGVTYLFLYPGIAASATDALNTRVTISTSGSSGETRLYQDLMGPLPFNTMTHVAVVLDGANDLMRLYVDAALTGSVAQTIQLSELNDVNNWLGRSQFVNDDELQGEIFEFRIYDAALNLAELQFSFDEGPDATFFGP